MTSFFVKLATSVFCLIVGGLLGAVFATLLQMHLPFDTFAYRFVGTLAVAATVASGFGTILAFVLAVAVFFVEDDA